MRAASENRVLAGALGIDESKLFTAVFALGAFLAGLAGALTLPREPANLGMDLAVIADAFVVTVLGGLGSIPGAFVAAIIIGVTKALCIAAGDVSIAGATLSMPKLTLVIEFIVMALVLLVRPSGLFGTPATVPATTSITVERALIARPARRHAIAAAVVIAAAALLPLAGDEYALVLTIDILIAALFTASLRLITGTGGLTSFGHAAYFGIGAYASALAATHGYPFPAALALAPVAATVAALAFGALCVRLSGIYLAMLTLAFAQIVWSIALQWDAVTGGSNGITGVLATGLARRPAALLPARARDRRHRDGRARHHCVHAVWLCTARESRFIASRGRIGHRCPRAAHQGARDRRRLRGHCGWTVRVLQRRHFTGCARDTALGRRAGHDAARRSERIVRAPARRRGIHLAAGRAGTRHRILAHGGRRGHPAGRERFPLRHRRHLRCLVASPSPPCERIPQSPWSRAPMNAPPLLVVDALSKSFGGVTAVRDVSFAVAAGEVVAMIGPNGAGKTTCFNLIHGELAPDGGDVRFDGRTLLGRPTHAIARRGIGRTFQVAATFASMTVRESVALALAAHDGRDGAAGFSMLDARSARIDALLARLRIGDLADAHCAALAYGDAKRLELALALAGEPRLLLMDEPTAGMTPRSRRDLMQLATGLAESDKVAVVFTEHDMDIVFGFAERVLVLDRGALIASGTPAEIKADARVQAVYLGVDEPAPSRVSE